MGQCATFEVCGLYFLLQRSYRPKPGGWAFHLRDEACTLVNEAFSANTYVDLFQQLELRIGITLPEETRAQLRDDLGPLSPTYVAAHEPLPANEHDPVGPQMPTAELAARHGRSGDRGQPIHP